MRTPSRIAVRLGQAIARRDAARARLWSQDRAATHAIADLVGVVILDACFDRDWLALAAWLRDLDLTAAAMRAVLAPVPADERARAAWMRSVIRVAGSWAVRNAAAHGDGSALRALLQRAITGTQAATLTHEDQTNAKHR